jgi:flagellar biosynthesis/type III secretory pathway protein FliH
MIMQTKRDHPRLILSESRKAYSAAEKIIESAKYEARKILKKASDDAERIKRNAYREGILSAKEKSVKYMVLANKYRAESEENAFQEIINLCMDTVYQFVEQFRSSDKEWLACRVKKGLEYLQDQRKVKIMLNPDDMESKMDVLRNISNTGVLNGTVKLVADRHVTPGDCVFKSSVGTINASVKECIKSIQSMLLEDYSSFDQEGDTNDE